MERSIHETFESIAHRAAEKATDEGTPLWLAREQLISAFDREAERRDAERAS
jgi:hypothetical protein